MTKALKAKFSAEITNNVRKLETRALIKQIEKVAVRAQLRLHSNPSAAEWGRISILMNFLHLCLKDLRKRSEDKWYILNFGSIGYLCKKTSWGKGVKTYALRCGENWRPLKKEGMFSLSALERHFLEGNAKRITNQSACAIVFESLEP